MQGREDLRGDINRLRSALFQDDGSIVILQEGIKILTYKIIEP